MQTALTITSATTAGTVSAAVDVSALVGDFTVTTIVTASTGTTALVSLQTSSDNFVANVVHEVVFHIAPGTSTSVAIPALRKYQLPASQFGVASVHARLAVQSILGYKASVSVAVAITS